MDHDLIKRKITEGLKFISLESSFLDRNISSLSGGEKQRVALLRTILTEPRILLLDEPLSNVDASLKETLREEIRELQKNLQITTIMVTHDKEDAFAISDEIAILLNKKIAQTGSPNYVYDHPSDYEVAKFLGSHQLFKGVLIENDGNQVKVEIGRNVHFHAIVHENEHFKINEELIVGIKSERLIIEPVDQYGSEFSLRGKICHVHILGPMVRYYVQLSEGLYIDVLEKNTGYSKPEELEISLQYVVDDVVLFSQKGRKYK
jgi:ABC-type Fe3+/spermidine/putrescine transport system ATPase subunit